MVPLCGSVRVAAFDRRAAPHQTGSSKMVAYRAVIAFLICAYYILAVALSEPESGLPCTPRGADLTEESEDRTSRIEL